MKTLKNGCVMLVAMVVAFGLLSCKGKYTQGKQEDYTMGEHGVYYYSLDYLRDFFRGQEEFDEYGRYSPDVSSIISAEQVAEKLPGIVLCTDEYAYCNVEGGGRYFVFWTKAYSIEQPTKEVVCVRDTAFIPDRIDSAKRQQLENLSIGQSLLQDVTHIDQDLELSNRLSSCDLISYSLIDSSAVLEIRYTYDASRKQYIVDSIKNCPMSTSAALFSVIKMSDFPTN